MRLATILIFAAALAWGCLPCAAQSTSDPFEFSSSLAVFSAHASAGSGVRLNWTLDHQAPTITKFRIYRGYEEVGKFAVLTEVPAQPAADAVAYSFKDTTARAQVSYYYKLAAVGQSSESVFPVVITAVPLAEGQTVMRELPAATILPEEKILLYVRRPGRVRLQVTSAPQKTLVDEAMAAGLYEFDPPAEGTLSLMLEHESGLRERLAWPIR